MRRLSLRALTIVVIGAIVLAVGILSVVAGIQHRYEAAQSAVTIRYQEMPENDAGYVYFSAEADGDSIDEDGLDDIVRNLQRSLRRIAEEEGRFSVPQVTAYVKGPKLVAVSADIPVFWVASSLYGRSDFQVRSYMLPGFLGTLTMLGGLFWLAARWHVTQPDRDREIDERRV